MTETNLALLDAFEVDQLEDALELDPNVQTLIDWENTQGDIMLEKHEEMRYALGL